MATLTKLDQAWQAVERMSRKQQKILAAHMNALLALPQAEVADAGVRPNALTMNEIRNEQQAVRQCRHEKIRERHA